MRNTNRKVAWGKHAVGNPTLQQTHPEPSHDDTSPMETWERGWNSDLTDRSWSSCVHSATEANIQQLFWFLPSWRCSSARTLSRPCAHHRPAANPDSGYTTASWYHQNHQQNWACIYTCRRAERLKRHADSTDLTSFRRETLKHLSSLSAVDVKLNIPVWPRPLSEIHPVLSHLQGAELSLPLKPPPLLFLPLSILHSARLFLFYPLFTPPPPLCNHGNRPSLFHDHADVRKQNMLHLCHGLLSESHQNKPTSTWFLFPTTKKIVKWDLSLVRR